MNMLKPKAILIGFTGKVPLAGMSLANLHVIDGLQELGYDVHYVERQNKRDQYYNPISNEMTDDLSFALDYLDNLFPRYGITQMQYSLIDRSNRCLGSGWGALLSALDHADFVLNLSDATWFDELERCPKRAFVDADPLFTQVEILEGKSFKATALKHYDTLFTFGVRMGKDDCILPTAGREWIPTFPAVATRFWNSTPIDESLPITTVMNWASGRDIKYNGRLYGYKGREFERFIDLPQRSSKQFVLAAGGAVPRERLDEYGWQLVSPLAKTGTIEAYQEFIAGSLADFGIAKHAYVESRCGWFSDRSTCYLAAGRPVLHQDTGCGDWLPTGEGVLLFSDVEDVLEALKSLDADYKQHARKAREIAEEYFEASKVLGRMLDDAGFR